MTTAKRFEDLDVWQRSKELTNLIYAFSKSDEFSRDFALRDQIRRASISIMSNIAEGFESSTQQIFIKYLGYAKASAGEVRSQLYIVKEQGYISEKDFGKALKQRKYAASNYLDLYNTSITNQTAAVCGKME